jgi:hypothetical protein
MNALRAALPEVGRRWDGECTRSRLALGVATTTIVGACLFGLTRAVGAEHFDCFHVCVGLAAALLGGYGALRAAGSVSAERRQGTWDLLRLTPLSSFEIAAGKFLGAPMFPAILALSLLPWALAGAPLSKYGTPDGALPLLAFLAATALGSWAIGLMVSALADERLGNSEGTQAFVVVLLLPLISGSVPSFARNNAELGFETGQYWGATLPLWLIAAATWLAFGAWAFEAARWRIAHDKLEPLRPWRISAFMIFVVLYFAGFKAYDGAERSALIAWPYVAALVASLAEPWSRVQWRTWLSGAAARRLSGAPVWMRALATLAAIAAALSLSAPEAPRFPILLALFAARDVCFLQWCRLRVRKNADFVAVVYLAILYGLPLLIGGIAAHGQVNYFFAAIVKPNLGFALNVLPGLVEAAAAAALLFHAV